MGIEWFIVAHIRLSESAYSAWLATDINFNFEVTFINPMETAPDPVVGAVSGFTKEKSTTSVAAFFAKELLWQRQNSASSVFRFKYNKEASALEFAMGLKAVSDSQISRNLAALFSITEYKNVPSSDMCIVSKSDFKNVRYINEIYQKNVIIMPKVTSEYFIPEHITQIYNTAKEIPFSMQEKNSSIDQDIITEFKNIINKQLEPGIEEILKTATEEQPSFITENSLFKTDGKNVLNNDGSIVKEADPLSFKSIGGYYATDAKNVYYASNKISGASPAAFSVLYWDYAKDETNAYFQGRLVCPLNGGDFRAMRPAYGYGASDFAVYYCGKIMEESDPKSFHAVGEGRQNDSIYFGADKNHVYLEGKIIPNIDPASFEHLGKHFFKDHNHVYHNATIVEGCSPENVKTLNDYYICDNRDVYFIHEGNIIALASTDVKSVKVNGFIAADKVNIYYMGVKIQDADGATADIFDKNNDGYITDKTKVFYCDEEIPASRQTFRTIGFGYATDGYKVFFRNNIVHNADPDSFNPTSYGSASDKFAKYSFAKQITKNLNKDVTNIAGDYFKKDKTIYYKNVEIENADYESFSVITPKKDENLNDILSSTEEKDNAYQNDFYAKDAVNVYYMGNIVKNADPYSFEILAQDKKDAPNANNSEKNAYAKDAKKVYYYGKEIIGVTPAEFKPHNIQNIWETKTNLYYKGKQLNYIDLPSFAHTEYNFYKDANGVYYGIEPLDGLLPDNLTVISQEYIKDEIFFCYVEITPSGKLIKNLFEADSNSFDLIDFNSAFSYDKFGLFFRGQRIEDIDIGNIIYLDDNYLRDLHNIFCGNIKLHGIDTEMFAPLGSWYASDGQSSFYQALRLDTIKPIHVLGSGYATDGEKFWIYGQEIANPEDDLFLRETLGVIL